MNSEKEIKITLGRIEGTTGEENYCYIEDTTNPEKNKSQTEGQKIKIKIPLTFEDPVKEKSFTANSLSSKEENKKNEEISYENFDAKELKEISYNFQENINYLIPNSASWFSFDAIHPFEIKANQEFFNGKFPSKTPEVYKQYRNFVINLYKENTEIYLSSTSKLIFY